MARVRTHHLRETKERGEESTMPTSNDTFTTQVFDEARIDGTFPGPEHTIGQENS